MRSRFLYLHPDCNVGKVAALDALQSAYTQYLQVCVSALLERHRFKLALSERKQLPVSETLTTNIQDACRGHAIGIVHGWAAGKYRTHLKGLIKQRYRDGEIDEQRRSALCILGKGLVDKPYGKITQQHIDLYWSWLLDPELAGNQPTISDRCGVRMTEFTGVFKFTTGALTPWWIAVSCLTSGKRLQLPLVGSPYVKQTTQLRKGVLARKDRRGRWRFEVCERDEVAIPAAENRPKVAIDVGLNCMVATSDGTLLGTSVKPKFDRLYKAVRTLRANRQRQGLKENSPKLDRLEQRLTGLVKTAAGRCANQLMARYPQHTIVCEDLDLRGLKGQKRFAYKAVHASVASKAPVDVRNPAYTSQPCPSCLYVSRRNRSGTKFHCRACGRKGHADVVGAVNLLRRSEDNQIDCDDDPSEVSTVVRARYVERRNRSPDSASLLRPALVPSSPDPYCGASRIGLNP